MSTQKFLFDRICTMTLHSVRCLSELNHGTLSLVIKGATMHKEVTFVTVSLSLTLVLFRSEDALST